MKKETGSLLVGLFVGAVIPCLIWMSVANLPGNISSRRQACQDVILKEMPGAAWIKGEPVWQEGYPNLICPVTVIESPVVHVYELIQTPYEE